MRRLSDRVRRFRIGSHHPDASRGQVIVLFALSLVALLLVAGLVLDAARVYTVLQYERSVADAAALAGAQDLQTLDASGNLTREVGPADYQRAQCDAYDLLVRELGGTNQLYDCAPGSTDLANFTDSVPPVANTSEADIGNYHVVITTYYDGAQTVDPSRAVKVAISQPSFALTFGNLICLLPGSGCTAGAPIWSPSVASVAGGGYEAQYAVVTLRGTHWLKKQDSNDDDITLTGGSTLNVVQGDVGTNTDLVTNGCGSTSPSSLKLAPGFRLDHYDDISLTWCPPIPKDHVIQSPIPDPGYWAAPPSAGIPSYSTPTAAQDAGCSQVSFGTIGSTYNTTNWPGLAAAGGLTTTNTVCYKPGVYTFDIHNTSNKTVVLLEPGMYWFNAGLTMYGPMIGGYQQGAPGVTLVFPEGSQCTATGGSSACNFAGNNSPLIALNMGSCTPSQLATNPLCAEAYGATPAPTWDSTDQRWDGSPVAQVSFRGKGSTTITVPETLVVTHDPGCTVQSDGTEPSTCNDTANNVLNLPGGGSVYIAGVQYAPSDNVHVSGGSGSNGTLGQIIAWTVTYNGSSSVSEYYPGNVGNMVLRLDTACSPGVICSP